jgi:hypothetical protein
VMVDIGNTDKHRANSFMSAYTLPSQPHIHPLIMT